MATGALTAWMSRPPAAGPTTNDPDRVVLSSEFASTYWSLRTSATKNVAFAVWSTVRAAPATRATAMSWANVIPPSQWASGRVRTASPWTRWLSTSSGRLRGWWSTQAPASIAIRFGAQTAAVTTPTWIGVACSVVTAISGIASSETRSPTSETPWAVQYVAKLRSRYSGTCRGSSGRLACRGIFTGSRQRSAASAAVGRGVCI